MEFFALGKSGAVFEKLETFEVSQHVIEIALISDEFTAVCPITGQPDFYTVKVRFMPDEKGLESKSFKLYLQTFRSTGVFCEALAVQIMSDVMSVVDALGCEVELTQRPRGGVSIVARAAIGRDI